MVFDTLKSVEELQEAGIPEKQAKAHVRVIQGVMESDLATKHDLDEQGKATARAFDELRKATARAFDEQGKATVRAFDEQGKATARAIDELRKATKLDLKELELRLTLRLIGVVLGGVGLLFGLLKLFPPSP